jgi:L-ascorbate metabolism protein UlaG (beta-lactamase superfamily)
MSTPPYFLADSTLVEPLVQGWAAWWMTVAPVPASLHLHSSLVPLLQSYLQSPDFHARAAKDPQLSGAAFVGVPTARAGQVRTLLQEMLTEQKERLQLAKALEEFQPWFLAEARGQPLAPFYEKLPAPLRGMVELVYDYNNRPTVRMLEGMTYRSPYHLPSLQALRLTRLGADAEREPLMTTPRLPEPGALDWRVPFHDPRVDELFRLDTRPQPLGRIAELLGVAAPDSLLPLLTSEAPSLPAPWEGQGPRIRYLGHATVLLEWKGRTVLVDPLVSPRPANGGASRFSFRDLPERIDYAVVTHAHADHFTLEALLRLRHRVGKLVVPRSAGMLLGDVSLRRLAMEAGFPDVVEVDSFETLPLPDGELISVPFLGEHGDVAHGKSAYVVRAGQERILFAADAACHDDTVYRRVRQALGPIQTVFMNTELEGSPLGFGQEALFPRRRDRKLDKERRCRGSNAAEGLRLLEVVGAKRLYNYAMGLEPWLAPIIGPASPPESSRMRESDKLLGEARGRGLEAVRLDGVTELVLGA